MHFSHWVPQLSVNGHPTYSRCHRNGLTAVNSTNIRPFALLDSENNNTNRNTDATNNIKQRLVSDRRPAVIWTQTMTDNNYHNNNTTRVDSGHLAFLSAFSFMYIYKTYQQPTTELYIDVIWHCVARQTLIIIIINTVHRLECIMGWTHCQSAQIWPVIARASHSLTCHPLTNHTCLHFPPAEHHRRLAGTYCTYPQRDGQAELTCVAGYILT